MEQTAENKIIDLNALNTDELRKLREDGVKEDEVITDTPNEVEGQKPTEAEPSEYNVNIIEKPKEGEDGITVEEDGQKPIEKKPDEKPVETKSATYEEFTAKYPELKDKVTEEKYKEMFVEPEKPTDAPPKETPQLQKVKLDTNDETEMIKRTDSAIRNDREIQNLLSKAGLKEFPKSEDEMDAFAETSPRLYFDFMEKQREVARSVAEGYVNEKDAKVNAPALRSMELNKFSDFIEEDVTKLHPGIKDDKETVEKIANALKDFSTTALKDPRYYVNYKGQMIPSREKLYTGWINSPTSKEIYRELAGKSNGSTPVESKKIENPKDFKAEIKRQIKGSSATTLDSVKSGGGAVKTVNVMNDNELTSLSLETLKKMKEKVSQKYR